MIYFIFLGFVGYCVGSILEDIIDCWGSEDSYDY